MNRSTLISQSMEEESLRPESSEASAFFQSPLSTRYASEEMRRLFSSQERHTTWRRVWIALAEAEKELGLPITDEQIDEMKEQVDKIDFHKAAEYEKALRHDVMAHIHAFGDQCPKARAIIHLGATSCLITDNADVVIYDKALKKIKQALQRLIEALREKADRYKELPCLSFTHYQPAQPTTVGKRFCLWLQNFELDLQDLEYRLGNLKLLGIKGATGTQASFLELFDGDHKKVENLEKAVVRRLGFSQAFPISGQTYTRKQDVYLLELLGGIAISAQKMATDLRLLANLKEIEEPFAKSQVGSSAMPYKRNPMQCERVCAISRYIISLADNAKNTAAIQWLERSLDDSANRRLTIPDGFLATDSILHQLIYIAENMDVYPKVIEKNLKRELPFLATEHILMASVKKGGDRQQIHERIRQHCMDVSNNIKLEGLENDLITRLAKDEEIPLEEEELNNLLTAENFIGCSPQQVSNYLNLLTDNPEV